jgi:hypothetical protein
MKPLISIVFLYRAENYSLAEIFLCSKEGFCSVELVTVLYRLNRGSSLVRYHSVNPLSSHCVRTYHVDNVGPEDPHTAAHYSTQRCAGLSYARRICFHGNQMHHVERYGETKFYKHHQASR